MSRPAHLRPSLVAVVGLGGVLGTALRYGLTTAVGSHGGFPTATLVENVVGALLLGALLETLLRRGEEGQRGRLLRLGLGTGVLGGFTTFSSLALEVTVLLGDGAWVVAGVYATASLVLGVLACVLGVSWAERLHVRRAARRAGDPLSAGGAP
ncbi:CrcB family protein [Actinotalea sp.]|uniref:fluoride efflux transporter FluC n=1 Tax=Actinotalea sp. TaxID=1872145 RepID=UPI002C345FC2|nr:CrcB family protein [Actinotalea sp.]HQY32960.1 CrcB family protein [Actinotalea sp.]HRA51214.1 CrcB family protein [Actinotalea sp.]